MKNRPEPKRSLDDLIAALGEDPSKVKPPKKRSVKDAIICLRERVGSKVFTKRELLALVEAAYPALAPVAIPNLEVSLSRAMDYVECIESGPQNIYRYRHPE